MATEVVKTVKSSGGDYTSLSAFVAGEQRNLVTADEIAVAECYTMTDTTKVTNSGWTVDATRFVKIYSPLSENYKLSVTASAYTYIFHNQTPFTQLIGVQIEINGGTTSYDAWCVYNNAGSNDGMTVDKCVIKGGAASANNEYGVSTPYSMTIKNTIICGFKNGTTNSRAVYPSGFNSSTTYILNSTISDSGEGVSQRNTHIVYLTNSAVFNNTDDIYGTVTITYSAGDDSDFASGTGNLQWTGGATDWNNNFTDYTTYDFSIVDTGADIYNAGTDLSGSGVTDDIIGTSRPQATTYDIGAFEHVSGGGGTIILVNLNGGIRDLNGGIRA